jgi:hypothetical protein
VAAWPALWQYNQLPVPDDPFWRDLQRGAGSPGWWHLHRPDPEEAQKAQDQLGREQLELNQEITNSDKLPDLAWVYTVIAGVLNILVIYDAAAGPAFGTAMPRPQETPKPAQEAALS